MIEISDLLLLDYGGVIVNVEDMGNVLDKLSNYFVLEPFTSFLAHLDIKQPINTKTDTNVEPGRYYMDADGKIYLHNDDDTENSGSSRKLQPLIINNKAIGISDLIYYAGENMHPSEETESFITAFFPKDLGSSLLNWQDIRIPSEIVAPIDKVTRSYFENKLKPNFEITVKSGKDIIVTTDDGRKEKRILAPVVTVSLLEIPAEVKISRDPTTFDNDVFVAICSLHESGVVRFTGNDIYRTMTGNSKAKASDDVLQKIDESWTRLTTTTMRLDSGTMGNAYGFVQYLRDRRIVEGGRDKVIITNQHGKFETTIYTILEKPTLLEYAQYISQVSRFPALEQNTPVRKTVEILSIQNALLEHIHAIPRLSNRILYETLYELLDTEDMTEANINTKKKRVRELIHKMLDYWQKQGVILSWKDIKKGNSFYAIEITTKKTQKSLTQSEHETSADTPEQMII